MSFLADVARDYAALLVSVCALFLTISQAATIRKHNRLALKQALERFHIRARYESAYGESFVYDSRDHGFN